MAGQYGFLTSSPTITDCVFKSNTCEDGGGAIYNRLSNSAISGCFFKESYSDYNGGAIANTGSIGSRTDITQLLPQ